MSVTVQMSLLLQPMNIMNTVFPQILAGPLYEAGLYKRQTFISNFPPFYYIYYVFYLCPFYYGVMYLTLKNMDINTQTPAD